MRCRTCEYPLWTIRARVCPECGSPFAPSEYEFNLNSVRFCCPHCDQVYFGTAANGHLEPAEFACVRCHRRVHMDEMVLLPREGIAERLTETARVPWTDTGRRWFVTRWFPTLGLSLGAPNRLMRMLPEDASSGRALWFAFFNINLGALLSVGVFFALGAILAFSSGGGGGALAGLGLLLMWIGVWLSASVLVPVLWAGVAHLICGPGSPKGARFSRTFQAICYSSGAMALTAVPCMGVYILPVAIVWWTVSATLALREAHGVSGARAFVGAAAAPGLVIGAGITWVVLTAFTGPTYTAGAGGGAAYWGALDRSKATSMAQTISSVAVFNQSRYPTHGLELLRSGSTQVSSFRSSTGVGTATYRGRSLFMYANGSASIADAIEALPDDVIAHRVGDFVFTWHGFTSTTDGDLWVAVLAPVAGSGVSGGVGSWWALEADGDVTEVDEGDRLNELAAQNRLRATHGLSALPDPGLVTDESPATP